MPTSIKATTTHEAVRRIQAMEAFKDRFYFKICEIALIYFNGNEDRARAFISGNSIPHYFEPYGSVRGKKGAKMYYIYDVQEHVTRGAWESA